MRILVADDDKMARHLLNRTLSRWGHDVVPVSDGAEAWEILREDNAPPVAILDWMMPEMTGIEVCRKVRQLPSPVTYLIVLTSKDEKEDIVTALEAGADDHITKPFTPAELRARLQVGERIITLQESLAERVRTLETALAQVKQLQGLLPMCAYCKKVRNDQSYWEQIEVYISERSEVTFSHGICPSCRETIVTPELEKWRKLGPRVRTGER
jgi:sigma-B regulation protein RsbU (phosphoserine phosphatase)